MYISYMRYVIFVIAGVGCEVDLALDAAEEGSGMESSGFDEDELAEGESDSTGADAERRSPDDLAGGPCASAATVRRCSAPLESGAQTGVQACAASRYIGEPLAWSACTEDLACIPGEMEDCFGGLVPCVILDSGELGFEECGFTPLAIDLDDRGFRFEPAAGRAFDIAANGACLDVDWPTDNIAWLALDRDGDGAIADGSELFGSGTPMVGPAATDGFLALAPLDDDNDGTIDPDDAAFARLVLWSDHDGDRRGTADELLALAQAGIPKIPLAYERRRECDARGNCIVERATVATANGPRPLVDVHLTCQ